MEAAVTGRSREAAVALPTAEREAVRRMAGRAGARPTAEREGAGSPTLPVADVNGQAEANTNGGRLAPVFCADKNASCFSCDQVGGGNRLLNRATMRGSSRTESQETTNITAGSGKQPVAKPMLPYHAAGIGPSAV